MSYNRMPSQSPDDAWTAASNNTYIKDNFAAGVPHIFQAKGDIAVATGASAADNLAVGENGSHLVRDNTQDTGVEWGKGLVPIGGILIWSGSIASIPSAWQICNGTNGTPDLRDRFVVGSGDGYTTGNTGGAATIDMTHSHTGWGNSGQANSHSHTMAGSGDLTGGAHQHPRQTTSDHFDGTNADLAWTLDEFCCKTDSHTHLGPIMPTNGTHTHTVSSWTTRPAQSHEIVSPSGDGLSSNESVLPPAYALAYIMRLS